MEKILICFLVVLLIFGILVVVDCFQTTHISDWGIVVDKHYEPARTYQSCHYDFNENRSTCTTKTDPESHELIIKTELSGLSTVNVSESTYYNYQIGDACRYSYAKTKWFNLRLSEKVHAE